MKKRLALLLTTTAIMQLTVINSVSATDVDEIYADVYGVVIDFDSTVENSMIEGYSLMVDGENTENSK